MLEMSKLVPQLLWAFEVSRYPFYDMSPHPTPAFSLSYAANQR